MTEQDFHTQLGNAAKTNQVLVTRNYQLNYNMYYYFVEHALVIKCLMDGEKDRGGPHHVDNDELLREIHTETYEGLISEEMYLLETTSTL